MADQDFNIKVVTTADTTGIRQTDAELTKLQRQQATFAETARRQAAAAATQAKATPAEATVGLTGTAIGVGTIITVLTSAINKWKEFNAEQDRWVDGMIKAAEKAHALGESIVAMQDAAISARRVGTEPLEQSFIRLQQEIIRLKTEQSLLNLPEQGEEWKKLNGEINVNQAQLRGVTSALQQQAAAAEKAAEAADKAARKKGQEEQSFIQGAVGGADVNVQRVLQNEEAARRAQAEGRGIEADKFTKSAEAFERGLGPSQKEELAGLKAAIQKMDGTLTQILSQFK